MASGTGVQAIGRWLAQKEEPMKFGRPILVTLLALTGLLVMAACGSDPTATPTRGAPTATPAPGETPQPTATPTPEPSFDAAEYFGGERIRIMVGFSPGGGYDTSARAFAAVASRHFPGNPEFIIENRPGSGGELVFGLVNQAYPDGLTASNMHPRFMKRELLGVDVPFFDLATVKWVGAPTSVITGSAYYVNCNIAETWEDVLALGREVTEGATAPGDTGSLGSSFAALLGEPIELVYGYGGTSEIMAGFDRGELDGTNRGNYTQAPRLFPEWIEDGILCPVMRWGATPEEDPLFAEYILETLGKEMPDHVFDITGADQGERAVYNASLVANEMLSRAVWLHPDTPDHIYQVWIESFEATINDPEFAEIMAAAGLEAGYLSPTEAEGFLDEASSTLAGSEELRAMFSELAGGTD